MIRTDYEKRKRDERDFIKLLHEAVIKHPAFGDGVMVLQLHGGVVSPAFMVQFKDGRTFEVRCSNDTIYPETPYDVVPPDEPYEEDE